MVSLKIEAFFPSGHIASMFIDTLSLWLAKYLLNIKISAAAFQFSNKLQLINILINPFSSTPTSTLWAGAGCWNYVCVYTRSRDSIMMKSWIKEMK